MGKCIIEAMTLWFSGKSSKHIKYIKYKIHNITQPINYYLFSFFVFLLSESLWLWYDTICNFVQHHHYTMLLLCFMSGSFSFRRRNIKSLFGNLYNEATFDLDLLWSMWTWWALCTGVFRAIQGNDIKNRNSDGLELCIPILFIKFF